MFITDLHMWQCVIKRVTQGKNTIYSFKEWISGVIKGYTISCGCDMLHFATRRATAHNFVCTCMREGDIYIYEYDSVNK